MGMLGVFKPPKYFNAAIDTLSAVLILTITILLYWYYFLIKHSQDFIFSITLTLHKMVSAYEALLRTLSFIAK